MLFYAATLGVRFVKTVYIAGLIYALANESIFFPIKGKSISTTDILKIILGFLSFDKTGKHPTYTTSCIYADLFL